MPEALEILEFANALAIGGTERQIVNLVRGIDPAQFRVHVGTLVRGGQLLGEIDERCVPVAEYRVRRLYGPGALRQQRRLASYLNRERIGLIHTHGFYANVFALPPAWLVRTPVRIASIRDDGSVWTKAQRAVDGLACRLANCTVVNAESIRRRLLDAGWSSESIAVIPNGVDIARFGKPRTAGLRGQLGLPETGPVVAVLARLAPCKGIEVFLDAVRGLADRFPDACFLVVGDEGVLGDRGIRPGAYRRALELRAKQLGLAERVVFAGFRLDVAEILAEVAISVLPSLTGEGLPNSVLESMAAGLPVVATTSGGTSEAVEDGQTGFLVPAGDSVALADAIARLLGDPALRSRMGAAGKRRIAERFSLDRMAREMQTLYSDLLCGSRGAVTSQGQVTVI